MECSKFLQTFYMLIALYVYICIHLYKVILFKAIERKIKNKLWYVLKKNDNYNEKICRILFFFL